MTQKTPSSRNSDNNETLSAIFEAAVTAARNGQYSEAETAFRHLNNTVPDQPAIHFNLGNVLKAQGRYREAIAAYQHARQLDPNDADVHYNLGNSHQKADQLADAVTSFQQAIQNRPTHLDARFNLAQTLMQLERFSDAVDAFNDLLHQDPNHYGAQLGLGLALTALGRCTAAIVQLNRAVALSPASFEAHAGIGDIHLTEGQVPEALDAYQRAIVLAPHQAELHNNLANAHYRMNQLDEAAVAYQRAVDIDPDNAAVWTNLGTTLHQQNFKNKAAECFRQAIAIDPAQKVAQHMAAALTGKTTEAAPMEYVQRLFDQYAPRFDSHLQQTLGYRVPEALHAALVAEAGPALHFASAIDLGCGTGISGVPFRNAIDRLVGIDISSEMVKFAEAKAIYDQLDIDEIHQYLDRSDERFDLFIATDLFIYVGALESLFQAIRNCAAPGAWVLSSIEESHRTDYRLRDTGRYAHSQPYIERLAATHHMRVRFALPHDIRMEAGHRIPGALIGLQFTHP